MKTSLESILAELYQTDPTLRDHEKELIPLIKRLLKDQPDAEPTEQFIAELRAQLQSQARSLQSTTLPAGHSSTERRLDPILSFFSLMKYSYAALGLVLGVLLTTPAVYYTLKNPSSPLKVLPTDDSLFSYSITKRPDNDFGDLAGGRSAGAETTSFSRNQSGGGGGGLGGGPTMDAKIAAGGNATSDMMIYPPQDFVQYEYVFNGDIPALTNDKVSVLKRQKNITRIPITAINGSFDLGSIDLNSFNNARVDSLTFTQDESYGYMISVMLSEGAIGINQNWAKWPHPEADCKDDACWRAMQVKITDIPADDVLLDIAHAFMKDHHIDLSAYGTPEVDHQWKVEYERATDKSMAYIPDTQRVIYPLLIEGQPVYDEGGTKAGIQVGVNVRERKVADVWGIMNNNFLRSDYAGVTDSEVVMKYLREFEQTPKEYLPQDTKVRTVKLQLGAPVVAYSRMYMYENNANDELYVPSLVFPVTNVPAGEYYYRSSIVVPLATDLLGRFQNIGRPMPLAEPGVVDPAATTDTPEATGVTAPGAVVPKENVPAGE